MGGCEKCSYNQCLIADEKDCVAVGWKSREERRCVSNTCTNNKDCRKFFTELCSFEDCAEGDLFCNENATCERVGAC